MRISFRKSILLAALHCAATTDIRYYLKGVHLAYTPAYKGGAQGSVIVTGTDGVILFAARITVQAESESIPAFDLIIPREIIKPALKGKSDTAILATVEGGHWALNGAMFSGIDGKYPDYRRILPAKVSGEKAQFDPDLLATGKAALAEFHGAKSKSYPYLWHNGTGPGVMALSSAPEAQVVIMPWRADRPGEFTPFFPKDAKAEAPAPTAEPQPTEEALAA